jgi:hypothetical protein
LDANTKTSEQLYEIRLNAGLDVAMFLISQGHAFHGHDESGTSLNKGNFLEMIDWYEKRMRMSDKHSKSYVKKMPT